MLVLKTQSSKLTSYIKKNIGYARSNTFCNEYILNKRRVQSLRQIKFESKCAPVFKKKPSCSPKDILKVVKKASYVDTYVHRCHALLCHG